MNQLITELLVEASQLTETHRYLWHATTPERAVSIVRSNAFQLTFAGGTQADNLHTKSMFYLSCSRIPDGGYTRGDYAKGVNCKFELDGDKLSHNHQIIPTSYWGASNDRRADENEDRIWSRHSAIKPASKYILALHIFIPREKNGRVVQRYVHDLIELAHGEVKTVFYDDMSAYRLVDQRRAVSPVQPEAVEWSVPYQRSDTSVRELERVVEWLGNPKPDDFYHKRGYYQDFYRSVECDVHNARSSKQENVQMILHKLSVLMRKVSARSVKELVQQAQEKAYQLYKAERA